MSLAQEDRDEGELDEEAGEDGQVDVDVDVSVSFSVSVIKNGKTLVYGPCAGSCVRSL